MLAKWIIGCGISLCSIVNASHADLMLKNAFRGDFLIGAAVNVDEFTEKNIKDSALIKAQFNSITSENALKWDSLHPQPNRYTFKESDQFVNFGEKNQMNIIGHTLIWHRQTPAWVFEDANGNRIDRNTLIERMREHIHAVVGRYKGKIHGWDVVNEALNDDGTMRKSPWMEIIGADYFVYAFQFAHEADPSAELYYNDYSLELAPKRAGAIALIRQLQVRNIPITAIGLQEHNTLEWPSSDDVANTIEAFAALGIKVNITELDIDVLPLAWQYENVPLSSQMFAKLNPYSKGLPASINQAQAKRYAELFTVFYTYSYVIDRVTVWGVFDGNSWLNNQPIKGRTNYPLLFDRQRQPKPAFHAILAQKSS